MKIKNLAFFGIMAAILGVNGAARADSTTIIASQAYVDAKDALKQDQDKRYENTLTTYNGLNKTDDQQKADYPSMYTLKQAIGNIDVTSAVSQQIRNSVTTTAPSEDAVYDEIHVSDGNYIQASNTVAENLTALDTRAKTNADNISTNTTNISTNTTNISANADAIAAINEAIEIGLKTKNAELAAAYNDWVDPEKGKRLYEGSYWTTLQGILTSQGLLDVDNVVADAQKGHQDLIPRNRNIQKGVLYMEGTGIENLTVSADPSAEKSWTTYAGRNNNIKNLETAKAMDQYVPTMAAVESRVLAGIDTAVRTAGSNVTSNIGTATEDAATNEFVTSVTTNNGIVTSVSSSKVANANVADNAAITTNKMGALTGYTIADSDADVAATDTLNAAIGKLAKRSTDNKTAITTLNGDDTTSGSVAKSIKDAVATLAVSDTADGKPVTAVSETNGKISVTRDVVKYDTAMDSKLSNVNATGDAGTAMTNCTLKSPCTLTMIWNNGAPVYEWTNMDTEDTSATL